MNTYEIPKVPGTEYGDFSAYLDQKYGAEGTETRTAFEDTAWDTYQADLLVSERKAARLTQEEVARRAGTTKAYISKVERGLISPTLSTFNRILAALGLRMELVPAIPGGLPDAPLVLAEPEAEYK